ncbi:MAG: hypothetical protein JXA06_08540 [Bacteroidetes bacterium]|nr:hypothetical protein [Bacteroidota bacterium]
MAAMNYKIPGLLSIGIMFIALAIAGYQLFMSSALIGILYALLLPVVFLNLLYFYCRKCPHVPDNSCRHVIFGPIVKKLYKLEEPSPYKISELFLALFPFILFILFPQYWLFQNKLLLTVFWILMIISGLIILFGVCRECRNTHCPGCHNLK